MAIRARGLAFQMPFRAVAAAASGCGKTYWVVRYLLEHHPGVPIVWVAPKYSLEQRALEAMRLALGPLWTQVDASDGWTDAVREKIMARLQHKARDQQLILVIDDMMSADRRSKFVSMLYTTARHLGTSIIELSQRLFPPDKEARTQRLNCTHYWLGRFAGGEREVSSLLQQLEARDRARAIAEEYARLMDADQFAHLIITVGEPRDSPLRYRTELDQGLAFD